MKTLQKLMDDILKWSDSTFGKEQGTVPILYHLKKEVNELLLSIKTGTGKPEMEFADCFMLLIDAASHYGLTADELISFSREKLRINKKRKWGKPDKNGVIEHIKETHE